MEIVFKSILKDYVPSPQPSSFYIPSQFKNLKRVNINKQDDTELRNVKHCMPFLDSYLTGYIIPIPVDIFIEYNFNEKRVDMKLSPEFHSNKYSWLIKPDFHQEHQMPNDLKLHSRTIDIIFKFANPWVIETPPGYSCLFTSPFNQNLPFKIVDGVVDTDDHNLPINFPFYWTGPVQESFHLAAGTPMALLIPFKREKWKMKTEQMSSDEMEKRDIKYFSKLYDRYKSLFWKKKSYK